MMFKIHEHDFYLIMKFSNFVPLSFFFFLFYDLVSFVNIGCQLAIIAFINSYLVFSL